MIGSDNDLLSLPTDLIYIVKGNYKYCSNRLIEMVDVIVVVTNFFNAMEKIPSLIVPYEKENEIFSADIPKLRDITIKTCQGKSSAWNS